MASVLVLGAAALGEAQTPGRDVDNISITGQQNLTLGSGARAYGMGGAFLARADDATAASWNPAGLSYLRLPELTLVGVHNSFDTQQPTPANNFQEHDRFVGGAIDFAAFTWPVAIGELGGAVQVSYQRAISFDGRRRIDLYRQKKIGEDDEGQAIYDPTQTELLQHTDGSSDGGFDVLAAGTGFRLSRRVRVGFAVNRWLNGYDQTLNRTLLAEPGRRPVREFGLDFRPRAWSFNFGVMISPVEALNLAAVYKTAPHAGVRLDKARRDTWGDVGTVEEVTTNDFSNPDATLDLPSSYGFGISWRPRDTLTLSADITRTRWSDSTIDGYFDLAVTPRDAEDGTPAAKPAATIRSAILYPTLRDPEAVVRQQTDSQQVRVGVEYVFLTRRLKVPLRVGYFSDRHIIPNPEGDIPRFDGITAGIGLALGSMLFDVAYVYEFGEYSAQGTVDETGVAQPDTRFSLRTDRVYASLIYRFSGRP